MKIRPFVLITLLALGLAAPAAAQPPPDAPGPPVAARKRFEKLRDRVLKDKVGLSEAKAKQVVTIFQKYRAERQKTQGEMQQARTALRKLLGDDSDDQQAYDTALTKLHRSAKKLDQLRDQQLTEVRAALSPKEQAKLLRAMQKVRRLLNERRADKPGKQGKPNKGKGPGGKPAKPGKKGASRPELEF
jgi:Spy/CpxP family protein refolding chaperone